MVDFEPWKNLDFTIIMYIMNNVHVMTLTYMSVIYHHYIPKD